MLMVTTCEGGTSEEEWYLDTGCSNHMTGHREWLVNLDLSKKTKIRLDDEKSLNAEGMENVVIHTKDGKTAIIENVFYVPNMKCNLLSVGQLLEKGF